MAWYSFLRKGEILGNSVVVGLYRHHSADVGGLYGNATPLAAFGHAKLLVEIGPLGEGALEGDPLVQLTTEFYQQFDGDPTLHYGVFQNEEAFSAFRAKIGEGTHCLLVLHFAPPTSPASPPPASLFSRFFAFLRRAAADAYIDRNARAKIFLYDWTTWITALLQGQYRLRECQLRGDASSQIALVVSRQSLVERLRTIHEEHLNFNGSAGKWGGRGYNCLTWGLHHLQGFVPALQLPRRWGALTSDLGMFTPEGHILDLALTYEEPVDFFIAILNILSSDANKQELARALDEDRSKIKMLYCLLYIALFKHITFFDRLHAFRNTTLEPRHREFLNPLHTIGGSDEPYFDYLKMRSSKIFSLRANPKLHDAWGKGWSPLGFLAYSGRTAQFALMMTWLCPALNSTLLAHKLHGNGHDHFMESPPLLLAYLCGLENKLLLRSFLETGNQLRFSNNKLVAFFSNPEERKILAKLPIRPHELGEAVTGQLIAIRQEIGLPAPHPV